MMPGQLDLFGALAPAAMPAPRPAAAVDATSSPRTCSCRVRACRSPAITDGTTCVEHHLPEIRAMRRPHLYVYGASIVIESMTWDAWDSCARQAGGAGDELAAATVTGEGDPAADHGQIDVAAATSDPAPRPTTSPLDISRLEGRRCWEWCGRGQVAPDARCHPASVYAAAPTFPCLACGREAFACRGVGLCCSAECSDLYRELKARPAGEVAAAWLDSAHFEDWLDRASMMAESAATAKSAATAERAALLVAWRAQGDAA